MYKNELLKPISGLHEVVDYSAIRPSGSRGLPSPSWLCKTTQEIASIHPVIEPPDTTPCASKPCLASQSSSSPMDELWVVSLPLGVLQLLKPIGDLKSRHATDTSAGLHTECNAPVPGRPCSFDGSNLRGRTLQRRSFK